MDRSFLVLLIDGSHFLLQLAVLPFVGVQAHGKEDNADNPV